MSSPYLNNLILFGGILTYLSVYFLGLDMGLITLESSFRAVCAVSSLVLKWYGFIIMQYYLHIFAISYVQGLFRSDMMSDELSAFL